MICNNINIVKSMVHYINFMKDTASKSMPFPSNGLGVTIRDRSYFAIHPTTILGTRPSVIPCTASLGLPLPASGFAFSSASRFAFSSPARVPRRCYQRWHLCNRRVVGVEKDKLPFARLPLVVPQHLAKSSQKTENYNLELIVVTFFTSFQFLCVKFTIQAMR